MTGKKFRALLLTLLFTALLTAVFVYIRTHQVAILAPAGTIAAEQRDLLVFATVLSMFVVLPVFVLTAAIVWRYRESNTKATYRPEWDSDVRAEAVWWGIPIAIIFILSVVTWQTTHRLDPFRALESSEKPLVVQVVAMQWKWLFIYPEQNIATVNSLYIPTHRPVTFHITSDAPMNSFWIPRLGGQVYAMAGMQTKLHLIATEVAEYPGVSANLSGAGFADMTFTVRAVDQTDFDEWTQWVQSNSRPLNNADYALLSTPSKAHPVTYFAPVEEGLYTAVIESYMTHPKTTTMHKKENDHAR